MNDPEQEEMSFLQKAYDRALKMANIVLPSTKKIGKQTSSAAYQDYRDGERHAAPQQGSWLQQAGEWWQDNVATPFHKTFVEPIQQARSRAAYEDYRAGERDVEPPGNRVLNLVFYALTDTILIPQRFSWNTWLGKAPNHFGIAIAEQIVPEQGTITVNGAYGQIEVENYLVAPGISIQSQWYSLLFDSRDGVRPQGGLGYAQVSDGQVLGNILDEKGRYTVNLGLGPNFDQTTAQGAYVAMATRIGLALEACGKYCDPANADRYNVILNRTMVAALSQNGPGYPAIAFHPDNLLLMDDDPEQDIDWVEFLRRFNNTTSADAMIRILLSSQPYEPDMMLQMYAQDLRQLHANGLNVPEETLTALDEILALLELAKIARLNESLLKKE